MVQLNEENSTQLAVHDKTTESKQRRINLVVRPNYTVSKVFRDVELQFQYDSFDLVLLPSNTSLPAVYLNDHKNDDLYSIYGFVPGSKNQLNLLPLNSWDKMTNSIPPRKPFSTKAIPNPQPTLNGTLSVGSAATTPITVDTSSNVSPMSPDPLSDDDLVLGASASPTEPEPLSTSSMVSNALVALDGPSYENHQGPYVAMADSTNEEGGASNYISSQLKSLSYQRPGATSGYVGLVNQAMTCYLNSLLQALFMTPEFRNALYRWESDNDNELKNIPYQLQKLFLNLQTSPKVAVETTDLTRSFGWDSTEAWQQHDIQELCRVMFDALEHKFKDTQQARLISNLYEGKMIDYVKCLECNREKSREDTFLDIPLPVRPFGSNVAYSSIEEALRAFVQPETLDGNNQYFCEQCDKKCDAHKGLKFKNFPYILTLHLKRFDFDYQTMHRIKLNDKVTFPQTLNLNTFVNSTDVQTFANLQNNNGHEHKNGFVNGVADDCSITDSGAAMEEDASSGIATTASSSQHENDMQDDDEGIDLSTSTDNRNQLLAANGPYMYELFAIMIHSGSASGGHYYAYIKDFESGMWFCFNDQTVSPITQEDIQDSFGGGSFKAYYSSVYTSSTNAYMLMYRQMDNRRNERSMKADQFPEHITKLLHRLANEEETRRNRTQVDPDIIKPKVYFFNPQTKQLKMSKIYVARTYELSTALECAYQSLNVEGIALLGDCRLVAYDSSNEVILQSFEGEDDRTIGSVLDMYYSNTSFLLEIRQPGEQFEVYPPNATTLKAFKVNMETCDVDGPFPVRAFESEKDDGLRRECAKKFGLNPEHVIVYAKCYITGAKVFVTVNENPTEENVEAFRDYVREHLNNITYFYLTLPSLTTHNLELHGVVSHDDVKELTPKQSPTENGIVKHVHEGGDVVDAVMMNRSLPSGLTNGASGDFRRGSPLPIISVSGGESNSEDSSLSDGDRTLVESTHNDSQVSSTSHSPQLSSPEDENGPKVSSSCQPLFHDDSDNEEEDYQIVYKMTQYFRTLQLTDVDYCRQTRATNMRTIESDDQAPDTTMIKVIVDKTMKIGSLKRHLESVIHVPTEYFKVIRKSSDSIKTDIMIRNEAVSYFVEGEDLKVDLGKNLRKDEYQGKIFYLKLSDFDDHTARLKSVCNWVFKLGLPVTEAKKQLITRLHRIDPKYHSLSLANCRLWEKGGRNLSKVLLDGQKLGLDYRVAPCCEYLIQECEDGISPYVNEDSQTLFVRRWHPSTLQLDKFQEITLENNDEIKNVLSRLSGIPEDNVAYANITTNSNLSILNINSSTTWFTTPAMSNNYPLYISPSGGIYLYKNTTESPKELTAEERRELNQKSSIYSPRRERALKIYVDSPPKSNPNMKENE